MSVARDTCKRRIGKSSRISILTETEVEFLEGRSHLEEVTWVDRRDGLKTSKRIDSVFVMIRAQPNTSWFKGVVNLDEKGSAHRPIVGHYRIRALITQ